MFNILVLSSPSFLNTWPCLFLRKVVIGSMVASPDVFISDVVLLGLASRVKLISASIICPNVAIESSHVLIPFNTVSKLVIYASLLAFHLPLYQSFCMLFFSNDAANKPNLPLRHTISQHQNKTYHVHHAFVRFPIDLGAPF